MESFDYIVVGAGSAGCVLANRLTEDGRHTVLVVEYGGSDNSLFIRMPSALSIPMNKARYNWFYQTEPEPNLNHRRLHTPRGKVAGTARGSTGSCMFVAIHLTSKAGRRRALAAGAGKTCCPISGVPRNAQKVVTPIVATPARCTRFMGHSGIRSIALGSRRGSKPATPRRPTAMAFSRKASDAWI